MLGYGMVKVFEVQYPPLELSKMLTPIGDLYPQGLLWTFMQGSRIYTLFAGAVEVTSATLLFFRRTTLLGALLSAAAMSHVVVLNFGYDVNVKLYSTHLLLIALFLLAPDLGRLGNVVLFNRPTTIASTEARSYAPFVRYSRLVLKSIVLGLALFGITSYCLEREKYFGDHVTKPPIYGMYEVEAFSRDGNLLAPLITDASRWRTAVFHASGPAGRSWLSIRMMDDSWHSYRTQYDKDPNRIMITDARGQSRKGRLEYSRTGASELLLQGELNSESLVIRLRRVDESRYLLLRREFHLVHASGGQLAR
jgi:YD repeat-containing protein